MFGLGSIILSFFGKIPGVGKFLGSKWFWIIIAVVGSLWFIEHSIDKYGDSIRNQITTQLRANEYKNQVDTMRIEIEGMQELRETQDERISELTQQREADGIAFRRRLAALQNSTLQGGIVGEFLTEASRQATREDGIPFEDYIDGSTPPPN